MVNVLHILRTAKWPALLCSYNVTWNLAVWEKGTSGPRTRELSTTEEEIRLDLWPVGITISQETHMDTCGNDYPGRPYTNCVSQIGNK